MGGRCYKVTAEDDDSSTCRSGLTCTGSPRDSKTLCVWDDITCNDCSSPSQYVTHARSHLLKQVKDFVNSITNQRKTKEINESCSPTNEATLEEALEEIKRIEKLAGSPDKDIQADRQNVRLLARLWESTRGYLRQGAQFCSGNLVCSSKTNLCTDKNKKPASSLAPKHFQCTSVILTPFLVHWISSLLFQ